MTRTILEKILKDTASQRRTFSARALLRLVPWQAGRLSFTLLAPLVLSLAMLHQTIGAHEGEDHSQPPAQTTETTTTAPTTTAAAPIRTAERNVTTSAGALRARLRQSPPDPRTGEEAQFEVELSERIEGGFGGSGDQPVSGTVTARITTAAGQILTDNIETHAEGSPPRPGVFGVHYVFANRGDYKIVFNIRTNDNREFSVDFPVTVTSAPVNWSFWLGLSLLGLLSSGAIYAYHRWQQRELDSEQIPRSIAWRRTLPVAITALIFFCAGTIALAYFSPPRERRSIAHIPANSGDEVNQLSAMGDPALGGSGAVITISKESQLLFGIRTAPVEERRIVSGLRTTGVVEARPDARAAVAPPVSGRVFFNEGITIGAAVGRGQNIGRVEQVLGAPEQASLEAQRIELRTAALEAQSRQSEQNALAQQARTRLAQARRELQRATNLLAVGAAPRRRVEEAQTAVRLAEQEVASAEAQSRVAAEQARFARESVARVNPVRTFPLIAPVTGIVSEVGVASGQYAEVGAGLLNIVNLSTVFLRAQIFERDLPIVRASTRASYTAPAFPGEVYTIGVGDNSDSGRLVSIGQTVDPQTRTISVIYEVQNPLNRLRDGMFVEITIDTTGDQTVLSVPKSAVITEQGRTFVFVFTGGERFERRIVTLGAEGQDYYEIRSGLQAGERVVTEGIYQLRSTQPG
jgi:membrane fusion protein, heavy metal efflux system